MKCVAVASFTFACLVVLSSARAAAPVQSPAAPAKKAPLPQAGSAADGLKALAGDAERNLRMQNALRFLAAQQKDGRFGMAKASDPGVTAIALSAVMKATAKLNADRPAWVASGLDYLVGLQKADGSIYQEGLQNYITSVSIEALVASGDAKYAKNIEKALGYVKQGQFDEGEGLSSENDNEYGGFGYGSPEHPDQDAKDHPDMSNTQLAMQAMHDAKVDKKDPAWAKAVTFLQHCQNSSETGAKPVTQADGKVVVPGNDGGGLYRPGSSKAGLDPAGKENTFHPRSYGSMTYALLKCYLFAGVDTKDPRVAAAIDWLHKNYTLEMNPGFEVGPKNTQYQGLYYYYLSLARALSGLGENSFKGGDGVEHRWRDELEAKLFAMQGEDGHWLNDKSGRWMEDNAVLTTSYALLALCETR